MCSFGTIFRFVLFWFSLAQPNTILYCSNNVFFFFFQKQSVWPKYFKKEAKSFDDVTAFQCTPSNRYFVSRVCSIYLWNFQPVSSTLTCNNLSSQSFNKIWWSWMVSWEKKLICLFVNYSTTVKSSYLHNAMVNYILGLMKVGPIK